MKRYISLIREDPVWSKVIGFSTIILLIRLADAVVSFWAPNLIQDAVGNPATMGLVLSIQSLVGLGADLIFPNLLKTATVKKLIILAIIMSIATSLSFFISSIKPMMLFFLIAMVMWGIYYELENFGTFQFVDNVVPPQTRSGAWGVMTSFRTLAYFLGPLIAIWLLMRGNIQTTIFTVSLLVLALIIFTLKSNMQDRPLETHLEHVKPLQELKHWSTLLMHVWPIVLMTLMMGFIDSTFWTTGAVFTEKLARQNALGGFLLPLYQLPALFIGIIVVRWKIYGGKKRLSQKFLLLGGLFLSLIFLNSSVIWLLLMVLVSATALGISYPLLDGVYSDIMSRLGKERKHMIGFTNSIVNISYIIWPPIAGLITKGAGERKTFVYMGIMTMVVSILLLLITPKKLKLPQTEISKWKD